MTDNTFGDELGQLPPELTLGATSAQIIRRGRRIRAIRQGSVVGAAAIAVAGITSVAALAGHGGTRVVQSGSGNGLGLGVPASASPAPASSTAAPSAVSSSTASSASAIGSSPASPGAPALHSSASPTALCSPAPQTTDGAPAANSDGNAPPWGVLTQAGIDAGTGNSVVVYGVHIDDAAIPCTHFGMMLGVVGASGTVTGVYEANESTSTDLSPGFHAVSLSSGGTQVAGTYLIGYYVGAASTVSVVLNGVPAAVHVAPWSVNSEVKFWWVGGLKNVPTDIALSAKDSAGNVLSMINPAQPAVG